VRKIIRGTCQMGVLAAILAGTMATAQAAPLWSKLPLLGEAKSTEHVVKVQSADETYRIGQLEEQVRSLNGKIEELGFQLLQMEERMRQMQEDNEFRFQQLEGGGGATAGANGDRTDAGPVSTDPAVTEEVPMDAAGLDTLPGVDGSGTASTTPDSGLGAPERTLGSLTFDENGNPVGGDAGDIPGGTETASLNNPTDLYQAGYSHMLAGDYQLAEQVFRDFVDIYPGDAQTPNAMFWLGEAQFSQGSYNDAAQTFLDAHKQFPQAEKGADTMLKLGMSLSALDKREPACSTYRQVLANYPGASQAVRTKVQQEQLKASC
jgi:tol-pal system protein YbgF